LAILKKSMYISLAISAIALGMLVLEGCGAAWQNAEQTVYLEQHPFLQGCILQQGVDPGALDACMNANTFNGANAALRCSGENWRNVQMCMIASKEQDEVVKTFEQVSAGPANTAAALGMIQMGNQIMQGPQRIIVEQR